MNDEDIARREALAILAGLAATLVTSEVQAGPELGRRPEPIARAPLASTNTDLSAAARKASEAIPGAMATWNAQARLQNVVVMAVSALQGKLVGPPPAFPTLTGPAAAFAGAFAKAIERWQASVSVPGLPWYPAFAAWPGPVAPPTPNVPTPAIALAYDPTPLLPANLASAVRQALGARASESGAAEAIDAFTREVGARFYLWLSSAQVTLVLGKGNVPTFAPPYCPVGPVVNGDAASTGSAFSIAWA